MALEGGGLQRRQPSARPRANANASGFNPAICSGVVVVAATDRYGARAYCSNFGSIGAIAAPAGDVRSPASNGIRSTLYARTTAPDRVTAALKGSARAFPGICSQCGVSLLDANAAVTKIKGGSTPATTDTDYLRISLSAGKTLSATLALGSTATTTDTCNTAVVARWR